MYQRLTTVESCLTSESFSLSIITEDIAAEIYKINRMRVVFPRLLHVDVRPTVNCETERQRLVGGSLYLPIAVVGC